MRISANWVTALDSRRTGDDVAWNSINASEMKLRLQVRLAAQSLASQRQHGRAYFSPALAYGRHFGPPSPSARQAAVLILLEPRGGAWSIPLTVRPDHLPDHPGQISLPGGRVENEETHRQAAEREFGEELGIAAFPAEIVGELQPIYVFNSNYYVRPFVAVCEQTLQYSPCPHEVARLIHLPLATLLDLSQHREAKFSRGQTTWKARTIACQQDQIWGATAIILGELLTVLDLEAVW